MTAAIVHEHRWRRSVHLDACHYFSSQYSCKCGATASTTTERSPADGYSAIWMDQAENEPCGRCDELMAGASVMHRVVVVGKDGTVEKETNIETCQEDAA